MKVKNYKCSEGDLLVWWMDRRVAGLTHYDYNYFVTALRAGTLTYCGIPVLMKRNSK